MTRSAQELIPLAKKCWIYYSKNMPIFIVFLALLLITLVFFLILSRQEKEKTEFFHVMAHKFRSPISIIKWYIELLSDDAVGTLNDKQKEYFAQIYKASERLNEDIDSLSVLLQLESNKLSLKIQTTNIKSLMDNVLAKLQFKIERHKLHLQEFYPKDKEITTQTDPKLLSIVFQNIIENAIKYTPENGNMSISVNAPNKKIFIEIKDDGYGIPKENKSRILANSINAKDMGFSLYLVKHILKKMQANISFESQENKGTTFYISLPLTS